ncbi:CHASE2 domain-containing protein [candidate division KSB1 bacterium]|nr:CHASE2 domain-containing protein [candidate division KSB1 bacterium]
MGRITRNNVLLAFFLSFLTFIVLFIVARFLLTSYFNRIESVIYDYRYNKKINHAFGNPAATIDDIVIVDIDQRSLDTIGPIVKWGTDPYLRAMQAIERSGSLVLGIDIPIPVPTRSSASSDSLLAFLSRSRMTCHAIPMIQSMPYFYQAQIDSLRKFKIVAKHALPVDSMLTTTIHPTELMTGVNYDVYDAVYRIGGVLIQPDHDNVVRSIPLVINHRSKIIPSFPLAVVMTLLRLENEQIHFHPRSSLEIQLNHDDYIRIPLNEKNEMLLNFQGATKTFKHISFSDIIIGNYDPAFFKDRIVLLGSSSENVYTGVSVPFQHEFSVIELHSNAICSIVTRDFIRELNPYLYYFILFLLMFVSVLIILTFRKSWSYPIITILISLLCIISVELLKYADIWLNMIVMVTGVVLASVVAGSYTRIHRKKNQQAMTSHFKNYISDEGLRALVKGSDLIALNGERRVASALFTNIRDFIKVVENLSPRELVNVLNEYLSGMSDVVVRHSGYIDKYEGDTIFALWGAPLKQEDHAIHACNAALEMQGKLNELQEKWKRDDLPKFQMQIGIDSGHLILGNIGGAYRFDYTAIGDTVNVAHRLEAANKMYNTKIIISESTFKLVQDMFWVRELDYVRVKGNKKAIKIFELIGHKSELIDQVRSSGFEYFLQGLSYYRQRDWVKAFNYFYKAVQLIPDDGPSIEFLRRCKIFIEQPRPEDWDGVYNLRSR